MMLFSPLVGSGWDKGIAEGLPVLDAAEAIPHDDYGRDVIDHKNTLTILERRLSGSTPSAANAATTTPPPQQRIRRQSVIVSTEIDLIIENQDGSTVAEATLHGLPTTPVEVPLPIGTLSLPALVNTPALISLPIADLNTGQPSSASSPVPSQSLSIQIPDSSSQVVISSPPTPIPSESTPTFPSAPSSTPFPSIATFNSTITTSSLLPSSSVTSQAHNNTTTTLLSTSRSTLLTSTSSRSTSNAVSSSSSSPSTDISATSTSGFDGFGSGGSSVTSAVSSATSTTAAATASQSPPTYVPVVGGVIGGLAGLALLLLAALFFLRWYKRRHRPPGQLQGDDESIPPGTSHSGAPMAYNSAAPWGTALAPFIRRMRPHSTATAATTETGTSERGFQKISGRKIESVLVSGGDGYEYGNRGPGAGNLSGQSFYHDSGGTYAGGASQNSSMVVGPASRKSVATSDFTDMSGIAGPSTAGRASDKEVVTMRSGPARQAVSSPAYTLGPQFSSGEAAQPSSERGYSPGPTHAIRPPDPLGRSRPSHDGSRGSKFAEDVN